MVSNWKEARKERRARKEARALLREVRSKSKRFSYRLPEEAQKELQLAQQELAEAVDKGDHDEVCVSLARLDDKFDRHLGFARKSTMREYVESIAVAVLIALFLRAFVVEAFKIPSGSMIPSLEVGDHIFVNKFIYGIRIPFTKIRFFDYREPRRGEVIVFMYPDQPDKDFIKRIVAVPGDRVAVRNNVIYLNGEKVPRTRVPGNCFFWDKKEDAPDWSREYCVKYEEHLGGLTYRTVESAYNNHRDYPGYQGCGNHMVADRRYPGECVVPDGYVFVMGDNRNNSHDSRYWGAVPIENIKGKALIVWWSSGPESPRWNRLFHVVD